MGNEMSAAAQLSEEERQQVLDGHPTLEGVANLLKSGKISNVVVIAGALLCAACQLHALNEKY